MTSEFYLTTKPYAFSRLQVGDYGKNGQSPFTKLYNFKE